MCVCVRVCACVCVWEQVVHDTEDVFMKTQIAAQLAADQLSLANLALKEQSGGGVYCHTSFSLSILITVSKTRTYMYMQTLLF